MFPKQHIIFSTIFCIILYPFIGNNIIIVWSASIFIDIDHYFWCIISKKLWNFAEAYKRYKREEFDNEKYKLHIFHLNELLILIGLLGFYNKIFLYIFIGILFHYILDWIDMYMYPGMVKGRTWSVIMYFKRKWST